MSTYTHYDMLGLNVEATFEEIKRAYKVEAMKWHPDRNNAKYAAERFMKIKEAYEILSNEESRNAYDKALRGEDSPSMLEDEGFVEELIVAAFEKINAGESDLAIIKFFTIKGLTVSEAKFLLDRIKVGKKKANTEFAGTQKSKKEISSLKLGLLAIFASGIVWVAYQLFAPLLKFVGFLTFGAANFLLKLAGYIVLLAAVVYVFLPFVFLPLINVCIDTFLK